MEEFFRESRVPTSVSGFVLNNSAAARRAEEVVSRSQGSCSLTSLRACVGPVVSDLGVEARRREATGGIEGR